MEKLQLVHSEGILARIRESTNHYAVTEHLEKKKYPVQVSLKLQRPIVSSATAPSSSALTNTMAPRRLHLARIRLKQEGIPVPGTRQREEGVPLVVLLEPLVLGVLPASVLPTVVTLLLLLGVVSCSVLPYMLRSVLGEVVESARRELALLGERKGKERVD